MKFALYLRDFNGVFSDEIYTGMIAGAEFLAGGVDTLTFGVTEYMRNMLNNVINGTGNYMVENPSLYRAGEMTEIAIEVTVTGGSAAMKIAAKKAIAKEAAKIAARTGSEEITNQILKKAQKNIVQNLRAEARAIAKRKVKDGGAVHHIHTLYGHPPMKGVSGGVQSHFPTLGIQWFANHKKNLVYVSKKKHKILHFRAYWAEKIVIKAYDPVFIGTRMNQVFHNDSEINIKVGCYNDLLGE